MIILIICAIAQGLTKAISDALAHGKVKTAKPTDFLGGESWRRKYKGGEKVNGEAFPLSTTLLVPLTDGWHLSNTGNMAAQIISIITALTMQVTMFWAVIYGVGYWVIRTITFHIIYTYYFK
jgi:hypothetical protein